MSDFRIEAVRSPNLTDAEARRRLAAVYRTILQAGRRGQARKGKNCTSGESGEPQERFERDTNVL